MPRLASDQTRESLSGSLWFLPLLMTLAALILGLVLAQINVRPDGFLDPVLFHGNAEEARRLLLSVATTTVGVFAIVVGLTLVALQVAANRYSPRLVRSFLRDRPTQVVLSLFMATFAYNAAGLYTVSAEDPNSPTDYPRLAVSVGLLLLFACIAALVYYVDRVAHSIQIHSILHNIGAAARRAIVAQPPGVGRASGQLDVGGESWEQPPPWAIQLIAQKSGYVQRLQTATLVQAAAAEDSVIRLVPGIGGHVVAGSALGWAWRATKEARPRAEPLETAVAKSVTIGAARSEHHDVALGAIQMVDVALLSMHVFDFHTVQQSADELAVLLSNIADLPLGTEAIADDTGAVRLVVPALTFEDYLELACGEIRRRGAAEPVVLRSLVKLLRSVGAITKPERLDLVREQLELVRSTAERSIQEPHDLELVLSDADDALLALGRA